MNVKTFFTGLIVCMTLPSIAAAQEPTCTDDIYTQLAREERLYRSVLFGLSKTEEMPTNSVLVDKEGDHWMKVADNTWRSTDPGNQGTTWTDATMDAQRDVPARRGILEIQKALSSELIPSVLQAMRATQCRMEAVCLAAQSSGSAEAGRPMNIQPEGCIQFQMPIIDSCKAVEFATYDSGACSAQVQTIVERESRMLELLFAYDASYRTLMQFAGTFEGFLTDFRFPLLQPLWQMVRTLGQFDNLPCFLAECNE